MSYITYRKHNGRSVSKFPFSQVFKGRVFLASGVIRVVDERLGTPLQPAFKYRAEV